MSTITPKPFTRATVPATGWTDGLLQDYNRGLFQWFANRLGSLHQLRQSFKKDVTVVDQIPG